MSRLPNKSANRSREIVPGLKKLPAKKRAKKQAGSKEIVIDLNNRKDLSSVIELLKRKVPNAPSTPMPSDLKPMLASSIEVPFDSADWQFELKLDGYRTIAYLEQAKVELRSRNNNSFSKKFEPVHSALQDWKINAVVDGEIVVLNDEGVPDFSGIQQWEKTKQGHLVFYVFDIIWLEGLSLMEEPLYIRREILNAIMPSSGVIRYSDHIDEIGKDFYEIARKNRMEGIIAKRKDSIYLPDTRVKSWLKIKIEERHEAIICGYTRKQDTDRLFSSLVLGIYENGKLTFIGQAGTGFSVAVQEELLKKMKPHITKKSPFDPTPPVAGAVWLKPFLVCEVKYTERTKEGVMRHASYQGLREDKAAFELNTDTAIELPEIQSANRAEEQVNTNSKAQTLIVDGHELKLTNLQKIFWPAGKITKGDLLKYYEDIAPYMLPYMINRPQSLNRFPNGINGESFYHKNMGGKVDPWIQTFKRFSESNGEPKDFLICTNTASLLYMVNLGCIEMNPWHSRVQTALYPDWSVIDLDPGEISFEKVIETARMVKEVLDSLQIPSYPKTSGSTGIHIYIPLGAKYNYEQSKQLAELIANMVHAELPDFTSLVRSPAKRTDKIYIDYLQNRPIQTICAPYSVRPKPGATVSAPLHWDEVKKGLKMEQFTMKNMLQRVKSEGDLFAGVLGKGIDLNKILKGLASLIKGAANV